MSITLLLQKDSLPEMDSRGIFLFNFLQPLQEPTS